jgi:hypothetical protein
MRQSNPIRQETEMKIEDIKWNTKRAKKLFERGLGFLEDAGMYPERPMYLRWAHEDMQLAARLDSVRLEKGDYEKYRVYDRKSGTRVGWVSKHGNEWSSCRRAPGETHGVFMGEFDGMVAAIEAILEDDYAAHLMTCHEAEAASEDFDRMIAAGTLRKIARPATFC